MQRLTQHKTIANLSGLLPRFSEPLLAAQMQLKAYVEALFEPADLVELRIIESWQSRGRKRTRLVKRFWTHAVELPDAWPSLHQLNSRGANVYSAVNPRCGRSGAKSSVNTIRCIWADFDNVDLTDAEARWQPHLPEPSVVVSSGHGIHAYWLFRRPFILRGAADRGRFEAMLRNVYRRVRSDSAQDVARFLRLPGFWHVKGLRSGTPPVPCQLLACNAGRTYPFATFSDYWNRAVAQEKKQALVPPASRRRPPAAQELRETVAELDREARDRSARDFAVVSRLLREGLTPEQIWPLVRDKSKFAARGRSYFEITIGNALRPWQSPTDDGRKSEDQATVAPDIETRTEQTEGKRR